MLTRRSARLVTTGLLLAVPVFGLTACRTSPDVAAYVGDTEVTIAQLEAAIEERTSGNETLAAVAEQQEEAFRRHVLNVLVQSKVYGEAAERYGLEVDGDDIRDEIDERLGDNDPDAVYEQLAQQGFSEQDLYEDARAALIRRGVAEAEGAEELEDSALQERYEAQKAELGEYSIGYITVPDQRTADAVLDAITASPEQYPALAARFPGVYTLEAFEQYAPDELPAVLAEGITGAEPGTGFTTPVEQAGGVVVTFLDEIVTPPFEDLRPQLAAEAADAAGAPLIAAVQEDLDVTLNPRFGTLDEQGRIVADEGGVVRILDEEGEDQAAE